MSQKQNAKFYIAVMGTWNWLDVAAHLLQRAGMSCETIPDFPSRMAFIKWVLTGQWRQFDVIHRVRGTSWFYGAVFALLGKPVIWHWIGTDVMVFGRICHSGGGLRGMLSRWAVKKWSYAHLADSPELAEELASYGVKANVVRLLPTVVEAEIESLPEKPCVLSYWSPINREFYKAPIIMQLAEAFPDIPFLIAGDDGTGMAAPENVKFLGRLPNLADIYSKVSVYIRLLEHDSLSAMVLEALARGRYVIYSKKFPYTELAQDFIEAKEALVKVLSAKEPNKSGAEYVRQNYNLQQQVEYLRELYSKWFGKKTIGAVINKDLV